IYTAGAAAGLMAGLGSSAFGVSAAFSAGLTAMSTSAVAAGIGAAVGSAASQLAGKAMGVVDSFSWKQVGISALTAAATAGVGGALSSAGGTVGTTGATATQSSWLSAAKTAINNGGWVAKGAISGVISYGSNYLANQVFGNNQSFSWASLGSSIVGSIAAAGIGAKGLLDGLGTTVSPYAYSLAGANAAAVIDDKWFGGSKPDYLNVSMAAIANAGVRQFGENADGWFADSNTNDLVANFNEEEFLRQEAIRSKTRPLYVADNSRNKDVISDYHPNQLPTISIRASQEGELMAGVIGDNLYIEDNSIKGELYTIKVEAEIPDTTTNTLDGARSFFQNRLQALEEWGNASVPFQYSWATPTINTGNPRLDRYYFQPINNAFNTVLNAGWNTLKLAGNTATMIGNSPTAAFSVVSGDYEASQQLYDDIFLSNPATVGVAGLTRASMTRLRVEKTLNAAAGTKRIPFHSQRGSIDLGFSSDIPVGSTTGEVLTASMPAPPIKALYPSTISTQVKAPFLTDANSKLVYGQGHLFEPIIPKLSTFEDRVKVTPINNGVWTGERGNSNFIFDDPDIQVILPNGIEYKNGYADFSPVALHEVRLNSIISTNRTANFRKADSMLAETLGVKTKDIDKFRNEQKYTWHEVEDMRTLQLVPSFIHTSPNQSMGGVGVKYGHFGGVGERSLLEGINGKVK
ncbi:HNH endonuclease, partial [Acinetobacter baumannii]|nr:HNH endonuclease [Acinetobacter baumannii]MDV7515075.1 HNH endonuclease [Acinetobacter baumannii]